MELGEGIQWQSSGEEQLARLFYRHVEAQDIAGRDPAAIVGCVRNLRDNALGREPATAVVVAGNPSVAGNGWSCGRTVITVVTDDMAFLVDSVAAELTRLGVGIHLLVHPVVVATRDGRGRLLDVAAPAMPDPDQPMQAPHRARALTPVGPPALESWMHIEVDWQPEHAALSRIELSLLRVLEDVRKAVTDWQPMLAAARRVATELAAAPPVGVPRVEIEESVELLRWLVDDNFTFLGYRPYQVEVRGEGSQDIALVAAPDTGLGILRSPYAESRSFASLPDAVRARAREPRPLILTKANRRSTVHRPAYLDYVGIKMFDEQGRVVGEHRFLGLFAASAYTQSVSRIPVISRKVRQLRSALGVSKSSHSGRDLQEFLETFPRDELFSADVADLLVVAEAALSMNERRATRLFLRTDPYQRFLTCVIYLPRDRYNTAVRLAIQDVLKDAVGAETVDYTARVTESALARLHIVVRMAPGRAVPAVDAADLEARVATVARSWEDDLLAALVAKYSEAHAHRVLSRFPEGFPQAYKETTPVSEAVADIEALERLSPVQPLAVSLRPADEESGAAANASLKLYALADISLARILPVLTSLGVEVVRERPARLVRSTAGDLAGPDVAWVYDFGLNSVGSGRLDTVRTLWESAFLACWTGQAEPDGFNVLVAEAGLSWREVWILRAYAAYLKQAGSSFSQPYLVSALVANPLVAGLLVELFATRFDPDFDDAERDEAQEAVSARIGHELDAVPSLDHDRILRSLGNLICATLRTNYYQADRPALALKLDPHALAELPAPKPRFEIWVHSPRVEGVHLRFGSVARGGLRWSDRREDFRTEILGLVKAQAVKNAVIVPVGAKGGFYVKALPSPADRDAWVAEGVAAYRTFVGSLLDVTDNLVAGQVVAPADVVRHDGDDPYLVVAADKGTARFSDIANAVAAEYGFWLGDAFASGGSAGYDHKAMGITARGAWESVKAHLRAMGRDVQAEEVTVVGIGDMSGDVFGNGMLLSERIRLVAAFDHRHIFLDPDPVAKVSHAERARLFALPRSSWADYDPARISAGGGVYPRSAKSIPITPQVRDLLDLQQAGAAITPTQMLRAILTARVDLLWNGGIGTYVKASAESNADVGDRANDQIRVNGSQLRAAVVGEGGNLGLTQRGRIEAARAGVRLNTDAIDNSAGVDTSDHEVNIKILLDSAIAAGRLPASERVPLLASMTPDVAASVLRDNVEQNILISFKRQQGVTMLAAMQRLVQELELHAELDRDLEALPSDAQFASLHAAGLGLTAPEIAVVVAYTKLAMKEAVLATEVPDEPWSMRWLSGYFPGPLRERFAEQLVKHPLRRQIIATGLVNEVVNCGGVTYQLRASEETGAGPAEIARAYAVSCEVFGLPSLWRKLEAHEGRVPPAALHALRGEVQRLLDRSTRWFLQSRGGTLDVPAEIARFATEVRRLAPAVPDLLVGAERERLDRRAGEFAAAGAPASLCLSVATMLDQFSLLDIVEVSMRTGTDAAEVAQLYFVLSERYDIDRYLSRISALPREDRWSSLARAALRSDLYGALATLTARVIRATPEGGHPQERAAAWEARHAEGLGRGRATLAQISRADRFDLASLSVALRVIRTLASQGA